MTRTTVIVCALVLATPALAAWNDEPIEFSAEPGTLQGDPVLVPAPNGDLFVAWGGQIGPGDDLIYVQRVDGAGPVWPDPVIVPAGWIMNRTLKAKPDGVGGVLLYWPTPTTSGSRVHRIAGDGTEPWGDPIWLDNSRYAYDLEPDGAGGVFLAWTEERVLGNPNIYVQHYDAAGTPQWQTDGVKLLPDFGAQNYANLAVVGADRLFVAFNDDGGLTPLVVQAFDFAGNPQWYQGLDPVARPISLSYPGGTDLDKIRPFMTPDGAGGVYVVGDPLDGAIRIQRLDTEAQPLWITNGQVLDAADARDPVLVSTFDGVIVVWVDHRSPWLHDIVFAQRLDAGGNWLWGTSSPLSNTARETQILRANSDGQNGAFLAWTEYDLSVPYDANVSYQWIDDTGTVAAPGSGTLITPTAGEQTSPDVAVLGDADPLVVWIDATGNTLMAYHPDQVELTAAPPSPSIPAAILYEANPNPFNPRTRLSYRVSTSQVVRLDVYDARGRHVRSLVDGLVEAGRHEANWDGRDDTGAPQPSGVYYVHLSTEAGLETGKVTLLK